MSGVFYQYRVYLSNGIALPVYRNESDELVLWEAIIELRKSFRGFNYFFFDKTNNIVAGILDPKSIIGIDRIFGIKPVDLDDRKKQIEEAKAKAENRQIKTLVGSTAIDITKGR